jgi:uncharacterized protein
MPTSSVQRPVVRSFKLPFAKEAAAWVRSGGHAFLWESDKRVLFVFSEPEDGDEADLGAWGVYDMGKWKWDVEKKGTLKGLATFRVPKDCMWIATRRAERDAIHRAPTRKVAFDCTKCAACCRDNEVFLQKEDVKRLVLGGRPELTRPPFARRRKDGKVVLTLLPNKDKSCRHLAKDNRCNIYALRPHSCSEFPMGSECCMYAREDGLGVYDGVPPGQ